MSVENQEEPETRPSEPPDALEDWLEDPDAMYSGETLPRNVGVATFLTLVNPGVGYAYVGRLTVGLVYDLVLVLLFAVAIIAHAVFRFSPLLPALCVIGSWTILNVMAALDVRAILREEGTEEYLLRPYNHWLPYLAVFTVCTLLPVYICVDVALSRLWLVADTPHDGMYPTLLHGDLLLVDRRALGDAPPTIGDIVSISADEPGAPVHHLRVIANAGEKVRVEDRALWIDDDLTDTFGPAPIPQVDLDPELAARLPQADGFKLLLETNRGASYPISISPEVVNNASVPTTLVPPGRVFLLGDNRSQVPAHRAPGTKMRDAREFDSQRLELLRGKPLFVLWSSDPDSGAIRWDRIGRRVQ
jgi:signal peptidase I